MTSVNNYAYSSKLEHLPAMDGINYQLPKAPPPKKRSICQIDEVVCAVRYCAGSQGSRLRRHDICGRANKRKPVLIEFDKLQLALL
jgi:hypothetical protein